MARLLSASLRRIKDSLIARSKSAALTRDLDARALSELGLPAAKTKFSLWAWFAPKP